MCYDSRFWYLITGVLHGVLHSNEVISVCVKIVHIMKSYVWSKNVFMMTVFYVVLRAKPLQECIGWIGDGMVCLQSDKGQSFSRHKSWVAQEAGWEFWCTDPILNSCIGCLTSHMTCFFFTQPLFLFGCFRIWLGPPSLNGNLEWGCISVMETLTHNKH